MNYIFLDSNISWSAKLAWQISETLWKSNVLYFSHFLEKFSVEIQLTNLGEINLERHWLAIGDRASVNEYTTRVAVLVQFAHNISK